MEYDLFLVNEMRAGIDTPTLRVYGWKPYAISIGYHQDIDDFDTSMVRKDGIDIVRRPTGGRAILHANEVTYSVVMNLAGVSVKRAYHFVHEGIVQGIQLLGIEACLAEANDNFRELYLDPATIPCFTTSAKSEIQCEGKKLVGSAQRRFGDVVLQHGSILLGSHHRRIVDYLAPHVRQSHGEIETHLLERTIEVETLVGRNVSFEEAASCLKRGFEMAHDIRFADSRAVVEDGVVA